MSRLCFVMAMILMTMGCARTPPEDTPKEELPKTVPFCTVGDPGFAFDGTVTARVVARHTLIEEKYDVVRVAFPPSDNPLGYPTIRYQDALMLGSKKDACKVGDEVQIRYVSLLHVAFAPADTPDKIERWSVNDDGMLDHIVGIVVGVIPKKE